jgi:hypothetical protein
MKLPGNMQAMMKQAEQMQKKLQEEIAQIRVEASAGGGMVTVKMDGKKNVTGVKIDPEVAGRPMRIKIALGASNAPNETAAPQAKPPQDDVSERALSHPEVRRFQEMFPDAQVRVVRNLKE